MCNYRKNRQIKCNNEDREKVKTREKQYREDHKEQIAERRKNNTSRTKKNLEAYRKEDVRVVYHCPFYNCHVKHYKNHSTRNRKQDMKNININLNEAEDDDVHNYFQNETN